MGLPPERIEMMKPRRTAGELPISPHYKCSPGNGSLQGIDDQGDNGLREIAFTNPGCESSVLVGYRNGRLENRSQNRKISQEDTFARMSNPLMRHTTNEGLVNQALTNNAAVVNAGASYQPHPFLPGINPSYPSCASNPYGAASEGNIRSPDQPGRVQCPGPHSSYPHEPDGSPDISSKRVEGFVPSELHNDPQGKNALCDKAFGTLENTLMTDGSDQATFNGKLSDGNGPLPSTTKAIPIALPSFSPQVERNGDHLSSSFPHSSSILSSSFKSGISYTASSRYKSGISKAQSRTLKRPNFSVWDSASGQELEEPPPRRQRTEKEKQKTARIRELGGACADCKKNHRSCKIEHLIPADGRYTKMLEPDISFLQEDMSQNLGTSYGTMGILESGLARTRLCSAPVNAPCLVTEAISGTGEQFMQYSYQSRPDSMPVSNMNGLYGDVQSLDFNARELQDPHTSTEQNFSLSQTHEYSFEDLFHFGDINDIDILHNLSF
ncbi:hypothetical protein D8B26_004049 [Coccidioides posadasii str. Silveira]|uniref:Uncharacterized protein n=1 Tax=Coccidioides posadasii (strain RMSCC 757 / Silveira) TaxID=443226 RepID=E9DHX1_COCPS|nr:conserved hypothetical protein [Coccidioides posadasii str. Silveira]QVM09388.1 hypothetical protein D8B26_004049 [Coccidioides posadasii str. Silveira]